MKMRTGEEVKRSENFANSLCTSPLIRAPRWDLVLLGPHLVDETASMSQMRSDMTTTTTTGDWILHSNHVKNCNARQQIGGGGDFACLSLSSTQAKPPDCDSNFWWKFVVH